MKLTLKIQREARECFDADMLARAVKAARKLGAHDRETAIARSPEVRAKAREAKRRALAVEIGDAYHARISAIYKSDRACVRYGVGGVEDKCWPYIGAKKRFPAVWHDAGARWEGREVVLENSRGNEVFRSPFPKGARFSHRASTHGDLYCVADPLNPSIMRRYDEAHRPTGYAVLFGSEWDHGQTVADCVAEHNRKVELIAARARERTETEREQRRLRLLARISDRVLVTREDARATGACVAGINGFCKRMGIADDVIAVPARDLVKMAIASGERQAQAAAIMACRRAIAA